jgi:hypothetical protein
MALHDTELIVTADKMIEAALEPFSRKLQCLAASMAAFIGVMHLLPGSSFWSPTFALAVQWAPEWLWGLTFIVVAAAHGLALYVNGNWRKRPWFTPLVRLVAIVLHIMLYWTLALAAMSENPNSAHVTHIIALSFVPLWCLSETWAEARAAIALVRARRLMRRR